MRSLRLLASFLAAFALGPIAAAAADKPSVIVILADDLGYGDLGCCGHPKFKTPGLDRMAAEGARLTNFNTPAPFCAPTRAALMTGRYPFRCGMMANPAPDGGPQADALHLPETEITLAQLFKQAGYATSMVGKWHLGHARPEWLPTHRGFDEYLGIPYSNDMRPVQLVEGDRPVEYPVVQANLTQRYTARALRFIERNRSRPFFLYLPHAMPHKPLAASETFYKQSSAGLYGDVISELDWSIGQVLAKLTELGLDAKTFVVFTSDNGPWYGGSSGGLRGMKGSTYEGGYRVPCIARWPGKIPAGHVSAQPAIMMDLFATTLKLAGIAAPGDRVIDGRDIMPLLTGDAKSPHEVIFGHQSRRLATVRDARWKLHVLPAHDRKERLEADGRWMDPRGPDGVTIIAPYEQYQPTDHPGLRTGDAPKAMQLFDLENDPGEQRDVASRHPDVVARLKQLYDETNKDVPQDPGAPPKKAKADFDVLVRNGRIVDGSGNPAFNGDVAIKDGRIAAVGKVNGTATSELDARGKVIAPGFIDVHTHSENLLKHPRAENFLRMGVTTIVTGNCGGSRTNIARFFAELEATNVTLNVATLIGHNSIRSNVMGGSFDRPPTAGELDRMKALVEQAMKDGAVGLSTGLIYLPGTFTKTDEIIELARVAAAHGGLYVSHIRYETARIFEALDELCRIAREAKIRAQVSHLKLSGPNAWGKADAVLALLDKVRAGGLDIAHDQYAYTASSTGLSRLIPDKAREGGSKKFLERLNDPQQKAWIVAEMKETLATSQRSDYGYAVIAQYRHDKSLNGRTISEAARLRRGSDSLDDQIELILDIERNGGGRGIYHAMNEADVRRFLRHPLTMVASDGGPQGPGDDLTHPRSYGNNARVLGRYVRELELLTLEEAVRKMTSLPAQTFRLKDRGEIKPGCAADLVVFDPEQVADRATFEQPRVYAAGFADVFVNGTPVLRNGDMTGARPGRPIRFSRESSPRPSP